nr:MAG TPA: hypothetical protein [Bacteriophage sp.]
MSSGRWPWNTGWSYEARSHELQKDFLIMARIIYKDGCDGQSRLESIEGIEIDLLNGQKALIYPKYSEEALLDLKDRDRWHDARVSGTAALRPEARPRSLCRNLPLKGSAGSDCRPCWRRWR